MIAQKMQAATSVLDQVLSLDKSAKKPAPKKTGLVSALQAHHGGPSDGPHATASVSATLGRKGVDDFDDDDAEDQPDQPEPDNSSPVYAPTVLANAHKSGSVSNWVKAQTFKKTRNQFEAIALAAAIDALLNEDGVSASAQGVEILCRRLTGVHLADENNNWDLCKAVEWPYDSESLLDQRLLSRAIKDAAALGRLRDRLVKPSGKGKSFNRRTFTSSSSTNHTNKKFGKSGVGPSAGAAQH